MIMTSITWAGPRSVQELAGYYRVFFFFGFSQGAVNKLF